MVYMSETFLPASSADENFLKIRDDSGSIRYKIYNNTVSSVIASSNNVLIKMDADSKTLKLPFKTQTEAQVALGKLKAAIRGIKVADTVKDQSFNAANFEIRGEHGSLKFDLDNFQSKNLRLGNGDMLITNVELKNEIDSTLNDYDKFYMFEHFLCAPYKMTTFSYSNAGFRGTTAVGHPGVMEIHLNASVNDACVWSGSNGFDLSNTTFFETIVKPPDIVLGNNHRFAIGFFNNTSVSNSNRNAIFFYDNSLNNNWLIKVQNSTSTLQNTMVPYSSNWTKMKIESTNNELYFYINDELVGSLSDNIPTETVGFGVAIERAESAVSYIEFLIDTVKCQSNF